jgi:glyoxylase-like metal-dependent hydrolase (beta-lactamase superfamily II)
MVDIKEVSENIYLIDNQLYSIPKWGSVYLVNEAKKALIDTGPTTSSNAVLEGIKMVGVGPEDIDYLIVTHIHLDHAGGVGTLLKDMPQARVVVHHKGARHLVNPVRLVDSVREAQGEKVMRLLGEVVPVETERVMPVSGDDVIKLSAQQALRFIDAPGHASHELCIYESRNHGLFSGDAVAISVAENRILLPVTPPPSFDLEAYLDTLKILMTLKATTLYFAHFGVVDKVQENLQLAMDKLQFWDKIVSKAIKEDGFDRAAEKFRTQLYLELEPVRKTASLYKYLTEGLVPLNVAGYLKYYQEKHKTN